MQNDKRLGRRQITTRIPTKEEVLPDLTLREAIEYVVVLKRAKNLKERTIRDYEINMNYLIEWITEKYGRVLPISTQMVRLLKKLVSESEHYFQSDYVFTTNYGEPLNEKTIQKALSKYAEKAKIGRSVSPHVLRHNFATMSANNGMSVFHLMKMLGHSDIKTTRKYVQISDSDLFEQHSMYSPLAKVFKRTQDGL